MIRWISVWCLSMLTSFSCWSSHILGGELTWSCQNGDYVFTLVFYRDCNGADINTVSENIRVWNHPSLTSITLPFVSRSDISPFCTEVSGGATALSCGTGPNAGNGIGAIEKVIYRSAPIALSGTPPPQGWIFTFDNFSRNNSITNLVSPSTYGMTITAKMYALANASSGCVDSSPQFLQDPHFVSCAGEPFDFNPNAVDPDLDSLDISFGNPFSDFPTGSYNPPINPVPVPFETGFSVNSPTPGPGINAANVAAQLDPSSGRLTFTANGIGSYVVKLVVRSFRNGQLTAEIEREMQLIQLACPVTNSAPIITPPFPGNSFVTTVTAGSLVNFNIVSNDLGNLQNGTPQSNYLSTSGPMYGTNFNSTSGCDIAPCATLSPAPIVIGNQGVSANFNWQTSCDHLVGTSGNGQDMVPYHFVFRVQDDVCPVPKVRYVTITVNVTNVGVIPAPDFHCTQSDESGDVTLQWTPVNDPSGTFVSYQIYSIQNGLLATIPSIGTSTWTDPSVTQQNDYYIGVVSGCNGNAIRFSDTLSNIFLQLNNPSNGTAVLQWNSPSGNSTAFSGSYYHIYREYPVGTWTLLDSLPMSLTFYKDTIDICQAFLRYKVVLAHTPCDFVSNFPGDDFEDMLTPDIPIISSASIDTATQQVVITWNENYQPDTYGYVIYTVDNSGFLYELDTVWGISNTTYVHNTDISVGPLTYSVAAFDSCFTAAIPPTYQTSAKAILHTTMFLEHELSICDNTVDLSWSAYEGWPAVLNYQILGSKNGGSWINLGQTASTDFTLNVETLANYCFVVQAISTLGDTSFSTLTCLNVVAPTIPAFHYLQVATVNSDGVALQHLVDASSGVTAIRFERQEDDGSFKVLATIPLTGNLVNYLDTEVEPDKQSYTYRSRIIDSCGKPGMASNIAKTVFLQVQHDDTRMISYLNWTPYVSFDGEVQHYQLYRSLDGSTTYSPLALLSKDDLSYQDDLGSLSFPGKACYLIDAIEGDNLYDSPMVSRSNEACSTFEPILYVPNAFFPEGVNKIFIPVLSNFDPTDYYFAIYDRLGRVLFETSSPGEGWNGDIAFSGKPAGAGVYQFLINLKDGNGIQITRRGHVTLID